MSPAAGTRLGPYEVLGLIGAGGMGEVHRARDTRLDRTVAIKVIPHEFSADPDPSAGSGSSRAKSRDERRALDWIAERPRPDNSGALAARSRTRISKRKH
jgi:serine/threonine protein kinase